MTMLAVLLLLVFSGSVLSDGESLLVTCGINDIECLGKSAERFLEQTYKGIPAYSIVPIDPLFISSLDLVFDSEGLVYKHTNLTVTGLRNQKLTDFKMDPKSKSVVFTTKADLTIVGDMSATFTKLSKTLAGHHTSHASVLGTAAYNYELKRDSKGIDRFEIGPDTITCKIVDTLKIELNPELEQTLSNDEDVKKISEEKKNELREVTFCKVVEKAYKAVIDNIRATTKVLPTSAFFKDLN